MTKTKVYFEGYHHDHAESIAKISLTSHLV